jgi:hypothetical protein
MAALGHHHKKIVIGERQRTSFNAAFPRAAQVQHMGSSGQRLMRSKQLTTDAVTAVNTTCTR